VVYKKYFEGAAMMISKNADQISNDAADLIATPFSVDLTIEGTADILLHKWSNEAVAEKAAAARGSKAKKTDDVESYVYRNETGYICLPGRYIIRSIVEAGRFHHDPRSTRKMAKELVQAGVICEDMLSPVLVNGEPASEWQYLDQQRVTVQRNGITRTRPAFTKGWQCRFILTSILPEYINQEFLRILAEGAGKFIGLGDFRPTYGRFFITKWELVRQAA
jgi:hypothetical protein